MRSFFARFALAVCVPLLLLFVCGIRASSSFISIKQGDSSKHYLNEIEHFMGQKPSKSAKRGQDIILKRIMGKADRTKKSGEMKAVEGGGSKRKREPPKHYVAEATTSKRQRVSNRDKGKVTKHREREESDSEEAEYEVESIIDEKFVRGKRQFKVRWLNYGPKHDCWVPEEDMSAKKLILEFEQKKAAEEENEDEDDDYEVEECIDVRGTKGNREFLIKWKNYSSRSNTWEPEENLDCPDLMKKCLEKKNPSKAAPKSKKTPKKKGPGKKTPNKKQKKNAKNGKADESEEETHEEAIEDEAEKEETAEDDEDDAEQDENRKEDAEEEGHADNEEEPDEDDEKPSKPGPKSKKKK
ncbi:chromo domain-containing protein cec-1-like isoform X2 [Cloeon dipterum]|uniref:chromo domain-containing protein cec-1-like isoform X2 n=1 Tax=Cloeon dipterum TaxID=197152 RepID=UPI00321F8E17